MKKLKNIHPLKEIVVHPSSRKRYAVASTLCITIGFLVTAKLCGAGTISRIGAASPISFVPAIIEVPGPVIVHQGKYHGKTGKNFSKKSGKEVSALAFARLGSLEPGTPN